MLGIADWPEPREEMIPKQELGFAPSNSGRTWEAAEDSASVVFLRVRCFLDRPTLTRSFIAKPNPKRNPAPPGAYLKEVSDLNFFVG
jgi:hypothetical protein